MLVENESLSEKRKRLKQRAFDIGLDNFSDEELLDYYLCLSTGGRNAEKLTKNLFDTYGNLKTILKTDARMIRTLDGATDVTSVFTALVQDFSCLIAEENNQNIEYLDDIEIRKYFCFNLLGYYPNERIVLIKLKKNLKVQGFEVVSKGGVNFSFVSPSQFARVLTIEKPEAIVVAHNHPDGESNPSAQDISFTNRLVDLADEFNSKLVDHIIVGKNNVFSFAENGLIRKPLSKK